MSPGTNDASLALRIGERLRALRKEQGLTLAALAGKTGVSVSYLSAVEKGINLPSLQVLAKLTEGLGVNIPAVVADEGSPRAAMGEIPRRPGVEMISHQMLQLESGVVRSARGETGKCPVSIPGRDLFVYVVDGHLILEIDDQTYELHTGDAADVSRPDAVSWSTPRASTVVWSSCPDQK